MQYFVVVAPVQLRTVWQATSRSISGEGLGKGKKPPRRR
jgi:hypothetical protein